MKNVWLKKIKEDEVKDAELYWNEFTILRLMKDANTITRYGRNNEKCMVKEKKR